jgi:fumarate hydratase class II
LLIKLLPVLPSEPVTCNKPWQKSILVTALNPIIGYALAAEVAKAAYIQGRPIIEVASEMTALSREDLEKLLEPSHLTQGGINE